MGNRASLSRSVVIAAKLALLALLLWGGRAEAAVLTVNLNTGTFSWTASVVDATHTAPTAYNVKCGAATGTYTITFVVTAPAVTVPVASVVPVPGVYFCVVTGANSFGESAPSNEVNFQSGYTPSAPSTLTVK